MDIIGNEDLFHSDEEYNNISLPSSPLSRDGAIPVNNDLEGKMFDNPTNVDD